MCLRGFQYGSSGFALKSAFVYNSNIQTNEKHIWKVSGKHNENDQHGYLGKENTL